MSGVEARIEVTQGGFDLELDLSVAPGEVVALLGPNGAGKTTTLRALAGLTALTSGSIDLDGESLDAPDYGRMVATEQRPVGVVFQEYLLFPHLSALDNVAFGLRARGAKRADARDAAHTWLARVGLTHHADSKPGQLSGGQAQRVALARALVTQPRLLLLDEPLAALDAGTRVEIRADLRHHLADYTGATVLVTHDPLDAMSLADRVVVLEGGRVVQQGSPRDLARAPRTDYVAKLVGLNFYRGNARGTRVELEGDGVLRIAHAADGDVLVAFAPAVVALHRRRPTDSSPRNVWSGTVMGMEQRADTVRVQVDAELSVLADITVAAVADLGLILGSDVWVSVKATETRTYPA